MKPLAWNSKKSSGSSISTSWFSSKRRLARLFFKEEICSDNVRGKEDDMFTRGVSSCQLWLNSRLAWVLA